MNNEQLKKISEELIDTFLKAGERSIKLREEGLKKEIKTDNTPVTNGDIEVNNILNDKILSITPNSIYNHVDKLNEEILKVTSEMGISHIERNFRAKHYLGLRFKNEVPNNFVDNLAKEKIFISARGKKSIRVTPHIWNNKNDIDKLIIGLRKVL